MSGDLALAPPPVVDLMIHEGAVDASTPADPALRVLTVVYDVDAPNEVDARFDALALFSELATERALPEAESVVAHVDNE